MQPLDNDNVQIDTFLQALDKLPDPRNKNKKSHLKINYSIIGSSTTTSPV